MKASRGTLLMALMGWSVAVGCDDVKGMKVVETADGLVLTSDDHGGTIST